MANKFYKYSIACVIVLFLCIGSINASNIFNNANNQNTWDSFKYTSFDKLLCGKSADYDIIVDIESFDDLIKLYDRINDPNSDIKNGSRILANLVKDNYDF
jgi:hypothetical protein